MTKQPSNTPSLLLAGAATADITPTAPVFLYGYPHVERTSTGVHDPLQCAALYLRSGDGQALFLANDLIHVNKRFTASVRRGIAERAGVPAEAIMVTATHTHSGPVMVDHVSNAADATVPKADPAYLRWAAEQMIAAGCAAVRAARPAEVGLVVARAAGVGTNRHDPAGPTDAEVPVLVARAKQGREPIAAMLVYGMHPTVLHEDSTLISGDFPHFTRRFLQEHAFTPACPVLYHIGAAGNQSPRHVTRGNTFGEAKRLGELLGQSVQDALASTVYRDDVQIATWQRFVDLTVRTMPTCEVAEGALEKARQRFSRLKREGAPRTEVRTAECDVFGAEETAELAHAATDGRLAAAAAECSPAEIHGVEIGPWKFVGWPGEWFVEYALEVKRRARDTFLITLANGDLQAYIATAEADAKGYYEARNALFSHVNGPRVVDETVTSLGGSR